MAVNRSIAGNIENTTVKNKSEEGVDIGNLQARFKELANNNNRSAKEDKELLETLKKLTDEHALSVRDRVKYEKEILKSEKQQLKDNKEGHKALETLGKTMGGLLRQGFQAITKGIDEGIKVYSQYAIKVNTAMLGAEKTYRLAVENLNNAIGSTGLARMSDVLSEMNNLTTRGIIANVEQKSFLAAIKDGIVSTFDVADSTMLRLIKLQGEESTTNRLVMQASLRDYLNAQYENSQYIYENYKQVSDSLLEATSLLTSSLSLSLESTVQKWMGSLSSVGMSTNAINNLAQAIGYLGSGDLQGMSSSGVQKLVMMGASRAGLSYSDMLIGGVSAENAEALMAGMVKYLGSLTGNNVILSEYAKIFGISVSDIVAARNATEEVDNILGSQIAYTETALSKYLTQYNETLNSVPSVLYDTLMDNMFFGMGMNVARSRGAYATYQVGGMLSSLGSDFAKSEGKIMSTIGTVMNIAGIAAQLGSALGIGQEDGGSASATARTLKNLVNSFGNLFAMPNSEQAFLGLGGFNVIGSSIEGGEGVWNPRIPNQSPYITTSGGEYGGSEAPGGVVDIDSALAEAESERGANDIYEFLSDDVVTITPYVGDEGNIFNLIAEYNKITATSTAGIWDVVNKIFNTGEIQLQLGNGNTESGPYNQQPGI